MSKLGKCHVQGNYYGTKKEILTHICIISLTNQELTLQKSVASSLLIERGQVLHLI